MPLPVSLHSGHISSCDLSREEETDIHDNTRSSVPLLHLAAMGASQPWTLLREKRGVSLWEDFKKGASHYRVKSSTRVMATVEEIMQVLDCPSSTTYRSFMRVMYKNVFADAAVIYHNALNNHENLAIRWCAFRCPNPLVCDQDFCLVEYTTNDVSCYGCAPGNNQQDGDVDSERELSPPVAIKFMQSVRIKQCPSLLESHKLERGDMPFCGFLFWPAKEDGVTKVIFVASIAQDVSHSRRHANRVLLQTLADSLGRLQNAVDAYRMGTKLANRAIEWVRDADRSECFICFRRFNHFRRRHHCRICGDVICKNCSAHKNVDLPSVGLTMLRMCKRCEGSGFVCETAPETHAVIPHRSASDQSSEEHRTALQRFYRKFNIAATKQHPSLPPPASPVTKIALSPPIAAMRMPMVGSPNRAFSPKAHGCEPAHLGQRFQRTFKLNYEVSKAHSPTKRQVNQLVSRTKTEEGTRSKMVPMDDILEALCDLATEALNCQFTAVTLTDQNRHLWKAKGSASLETAPLDLLCCDVILSELKPVMILDINTDKRFSKMRIAQHPYNMKFYAGTPLFDSEGNCFGAVCVMDGNPRTTVEDSHIKVMGNLSQLASMSIQQRKERLEKITSNQELKDLGPPAEMRMLNMLLKAKQTQSQMQIGINQHKW